jgi:hypothetical protein
MLFRNCSVFMEKNHVSAECLALTYLPRSRIVIWVTYGAVLMLTLGVVGALHIQFSRSSFRKESTASLLLLALGAAGVCIGLAYRPF